MQGLECIVRVPPRVTYAFVGGPVVIVFDTIHRCHFQGRLEKSRHIESNVEKVIDLICC
jgi:hypothetical protein